MTQREVTLEGGVPWGFRMHGGVDSKTQLKISRVNPGSKAAQRGIREGDFVTSINDESTRNLTNNEAHSLLKKSGSTLKLGLNQDIEGSPKRRQYRTIHHETHQETVKRSSVSYTLKESIERSSPRRHTSSNEFDVFRTNEIINNGRGTKQNGTDVTVITNIPVSQKSTPSSSSTSTPSTLVPEGRNISSDHAVASRQSSYSNCSSIPDEGSQQDSREEETRDMNNEQERMSKSKKRRQRRKNVFNRSLSQESQVQINEIGQKSPTDDNLAEIVLEPASKNIEILRLKRIEHKYKVESPKELSLRQHKKLKVKSKSLDDNDDDLLKIQELSEASESEDSKYQLNVVISEASSEENLLNDSDVEIPGKRSGLDSLALQLNDDNQIETVSHISPEEEQALRNFLGGLNLVDSPEESAKDLYERTSLSNDVKTKKIQKRKELEEYFTPIAQNPRFLDAISEEASDISDKECGGSSSHIKQGTPEQDLGLKPILVEAKVLQPLEEGICSTKVVTNDEERAEVVYLQDSSASSSSGDFEDAKNSENNDLGFRDSLHVESHESLSTVLSSHTNTTKKLSESQEESNEAILSQLTPPPTPNGLPKVDKGTPRTQEMAFDYTRIPNVLKEKEPAKNSETRSVSATHMSKKVVNGCLDNMEFRKVKVDEISKNGDMEVRKDFEEYTSKQNGDVNEKLKDISTQVTKEDLINENNKKESVLRHVIMTSQDSNKTDSQKLVEFENIRKLNSELKDKINKQELIGPAFKKSKSPIVMQCEEELSGKAFVEKRVKEFSQQHVDVEESNSSETSHNLVQSRIKTFCNGDLVQKPEESVLKRLIFLEDQNNNEFAKQEVESNAEEGSILKRLLSCHEEDNETLPDDKLKTTTSAKYVATNNKQTVSCFEENQVVETLANAKLKTTANVPNECANKVLDNVTTTVVSAPHENYVQKEATNVKNILSCFKENEDVKELETLTNASKVLHNDLQTDKQLLSCRKGAEKIIPIKVESLADAKLKTVANVQNEDANKALDNDFQKGTINDNKENKGAEKIIPIKLETLVDAKLNKDANKELNNDFHKTASNDKQTLNCHNGAEKIIPVKLESLANAKLKTVANLQNEDANKALDNDFQKNDNKENKGAEKIIPIRLETLEDAKLNKDANKELDKDFPKVASNNKQTLNNGAEKIIPIKLETLVDAKLNEGTNKVVENEFQKAASNDKQTLNRQKENKGTETIIPIRLETLVDAKPKIATNVHNEGANNNFQKVTAEHIIPVQIDPNLTTKSENSRNLTTEHIKTINESLKNILEKTVTKYDDNKPPKQNKEMKPEPPVPPPRRSKALLLKKRAENMQKSEPKIPEKPSMPSEIPESSDITHTNVLSPPRPASANSDTSSSEESSRCTAKYNPNSSIADVASIAKDEEQTHEPMSLRNIVLKALITLPFGEEVLKELADVAKTIERFTKNNNPAHTDDKNNDFSAMPGQYYYSQRDVARNSYEDERRKIVELHQKFLAKREHQDATTDNRESEVMSPNRLLTIIREEPNESELTNEFLYFEDKSDQRLKAKNLGEWLSLARNKSKSTSNLDSTNIPINNLRRTITSTQNEQAKFSNTRRFSLPQEIYEKQLIDIMEKEREIQRELEKLEEEKRMLRAEIAPSRQREFQVDDFYVSKKGDFAERREDKRERPASMPVFPTEFFRQQMYEEYMDKFSEREERKQHKVIKISSSNDLEQASKPKEIIHPIEIEKEFMDRVKEKLKKTETSENSNEHIAATPKDSSSDEAPVIVLDGDKVKGIETLPRHLQEFLDDLTTQQDESRLPRPIIAQCDKKCCKEARRIYRVLAKNKTNKNCSLLHEIDASLTLAKGFLFGKKGIWSPGQPRRPPSPQSKPYQRTDSQNSQGRNEPASPVWTPKSANSSPTVERKEFRPVSFQSPVLSRKNRTRSETIPTPDSITSEPPWKLPEGSSDTALNLSSTLDRRLPTSQSTPGFGSFSTSPRLPKAQNPTITLLQKAREGQLPRGAHYIDQDRRPPNDRPPIKYPGEVLYSIKNEYTSESDSERPKKMADLAPRKFEGIGPTTKDGMPLVLRSEVKDKDQSKWYKRMYDTIHKQKPHRDEYVTIKYKQKRAQYPYTSGYLSEPEPGAYDSDFTEYKYQTLDRRRTPQTHHYVNNHATMPRSVPEKSYSSSDIIKNTQDKYANQPGRIENYRPGHSSISEREAKQWWDEVMDIFDGHLEQQNRVASQKPRSFINQALKESGYESDSTLVFKRKEETAASQISPREQREAYKLIQKGGDVPFQGLRKPAPERPKETDLVEFFPISPTLTKIRIHKSIIPPKEFVIPEQEFFCYPATVHHNASKTFANFKRTAPSSINVPNVSTPPLIPTPPPSPPKRKSSRNNTTLRLISTMKVKTEKSPIWKRHETCFTSGPSVDKTKVNYLRDKITCKLSPVTKKKGETSKLSVVKKVSASPEMKSKITSTLTTSRDPKTSMRKIQSSTKVSSDKLQRGLYKSGSTGSIISKKSSTESLSSRTSTPVKTFGTEKKKFYYEKSKLPKSGSEELLSPTEVKKAIKNISSAQYKESLALLSSAKFSHDNKALPIKVGITEKGKNILKSTLKKPSNVSPKNNRKATVQSPTNSERSRLKSSTESLLATPKPIKKSSLSSLKSKDKKTQHKSKKDQINDSLKQGSNKCFSKATGADVAKKLDSIGSSEISKQKEAIESNHFFRNLFLRNIKQSASFVFPKNSWLIEKTNQLTRRRASFSEPSIGAMKIYLKHTRPVSDSRFISLDIIRSRSTSPKSVTFSDNIATEANGVSKRSKSLPSKLIFSQTSRPVSPVVAKKRPIFKPQTKDSLVTIKRSPSPPSKLVFTQTSRPVSPLITRKPRHQDNLALVRRSPSPPTKLFFSETSRPVSPEVRRKIILESPPASPLLPRSPSCRKIMQKKQQQIYEHNKPQELTLYTCPELKHSTTSLDSFRSEDYHVYLKDLVFGGDQSERFRDLNHFYSDIEKVGQLEQTFCSKPRKRCENEIIDYDRWMEVRTRERAEHELKYLYNHLKVHEKEKGFLFLPKDVERYRWRKELDRGLRIKEKSVENIKEEFERLKSEESDRESAKRREIAYSKDTYKPLWRGNSVINLANILSERRSQSEGRVKTARQKLLDNERLLTHGIGSRIWSSLSMEQVNNLKKQLQEIYGDDQIKDTPSKEFIVEVPKQPERKYIPQLTIRRNSESSKPDLMSEDEKKIISQTLSREVLEKISKKRKEDKLALPLVVGKEVLGYVATQEANVKLLPRKEEPQKALIKTNALALAKQNSISETESGSTDESTRTVINLKDVQKKVEYFEKAKELETYVPTVHKPAEDGSSNSEEATEIDKTAELKEDKKPIHASKSCQSLKEYFGETELVKFATVPLSATRKSEYIYTKKPHLRALDISPIRTISEANSVDSLNRSRSASPYREEAQALAKKGEVKKLRRQFEFFEDFFGEKKLKRSRSENDLKVYGHVDDLRRKYEYPVHSGRGRSRVKRGGMVSPVWLRAEDRYMPHINIISKIASLYSFSKHRTDKEASKSMEELAEILGCPVGEVEKMKDKFDKMRAHEEQQISLMGHMYTSSPNLKELRDITPYLTANWIAHRYPKSEDNTRSLSSPEHSVASRDTTLVRKDRHRPKSSSPLRQSILKQMGERTNERFETSSRYTKEPDLPPPPPPPKSQGGVRSQEQESPRKYVENEVTIHYKTPVRTEIKDYVSEDELAHRQAEAMKKIYEEEKKRKYLQVSTPGTQELQDMKSRRHTDNFIPSQKSPIPLNRYDNFDDLSTPTKTRPRSPEPRLVAKALYNFVGQTARELTFRKGELIYVRRQVDKNWYEGELNAMVGLFPVNYVEIVPYEGIKTTPRKAHEGQARAKYNFLAQTQLELSLAKGELVTVTRKVDDNWFEGKIGGRKGIFPVSYVDILIDPSEPPPPNTKPVASPAAHSLLLNGSAQGKESMGSHLYAPSLTNKDSGYHRAKPVQLSGIGTYSTLPKTSRSPIDQTLHIETQAEPIPYRALYRYTPQNDDELELLEGDTVYVLEKCDDGWYVGSSDRTGAFGTFPGNYVEKI